MALLKALCWALIFIIRIRFLPGTSLAIVLINDKLKLNFNIYSSLYFHAIHLMLSIHIFVVCHLSATDYRVVKRAVRYS